MIEQSKVHELFATPIWVVDLAADHAAALNARLLAEINTLIGPVNPLAPGQMNWQTPTDLHRRPQFAEIVDLFQQAGLAAAEYLKLRPRDLAVTGCWANVNPMGGHNEWHVHPNNYLSGVYYVAIPAGEGKIAFQDPRVQAQVMMPPVTGFTNHNANIASFEAKPGRLIVFPAWLAHSVPSNRSSENRISISFNLMFRNFAEEASPPLWQGNTAKT